MLVDPHGRAYVGNFGDSSGPDVAVTPADLALVLPDGEVRIAAEGMHLANGMTLLKEGNMLVVAETRAEPPRLSAFDVAADGALQNRRVLVTLGQAMPDGMVADVEDHIWFASPFTSEVIRVTPSGEIVQRIPLERPPYACALGGEQGRTLFLCVSNDWSPEETRSQRSGAILARTVEVPASTSAH